MNTAPQFRYRQPLSSEPEPEFDDLTQGEPLVEHLTVPGFMARVPRQWQVDEAIRFGSQLGKAAEAMHLAYMTITDRSLGVLRVFPVPLMRRVYKLMARQFGWPLLPEVLENRRPAEDDRLAQHLQALVIVADAEVQQHIAEVLEFLDRRKKAV